MKVPLAANGDILCPNDIRKLQRYKGKDIVNLVCESFMIARGAIHNPNIFNEFKEEEDNEDQNCDDQLDNNYEEIVDDEEEEGDKPGKPGKSEKANKLDIAKTLKSEKDMKNKSQDDDPQTSNKLRRIFELKYNNKIIDIIPIIKEYIEIVLILIKTRLFKQGIILTIPSITPYISLKHTKNILRYFNLFNHLNPLLNFGNL